MCCPMLRSPVPIRSNPECRASPPSFNGCEEESGYSPWEGVLLSLSLHSSDEGAAGRDRRSFLRWAQS